KFATHPASMLGELRVRGTSALMDRAPHALGRRRHGEVADPERGERIDDRVHHRRRGGHGSAFANALDADRVRFARNRTEIHGHARQRVGARNGIIHQTAGQELASIRVVNDVLEQRLAGALGNAAVDLPLGEQRVDHGADVVDDRIALDGNGACLGIDFHFADVTAVGEARHVGGQCPRAWATPPSSLGSPSGMKDIWATWGMGMILSVPATANLPSSNTMSVSFASMKWPAKRLPRSITSSAAARSALPPTIVLREA